MQVLGALAAALRALKKRKLELVLLEVSTQTDSISSATERRTRPCVRRLREERGEHGTDQRERGISKKPFGRCFFGLGFSNVPRTPKIPPKKKER